MVALPNPGFELKNHRWRPGAVAPSREVPSQICAVLGQKQPFFAQNSPRTRPKSPNEGIRWLHSTCGLTSNCQRALWCPSTPLYVRVTAQKRRQKAPKSAQCAPTPRNQERAVSWATWLKNEFRGHLVHPQPPTFCGFQAAKSPTEKPRPPNQWSLGGAGGQPGPRTAGANGGSTRVPGAKKIIFSKDVPRPLGMLKQVFLACFEPVVTRFGPSKIPKCLETGPFWDQKWVQNGSKTCFCKGDPGPFGMLKQVFLAHFEPVVKCFGPWKIPKCLKNGSF